METPDLSIELPDDQNETENISLDLVGMDDDEFNTLCMQMDMLSEEVKEKPVEKQVEVSKERIEFLNKVDDESVIKEYLEYGIDQENFETITSLNLDLIRKSYLCYVKSCNQPVSRGAEDGIGQFYLIRSVDNNGSRLAFSVNNGKHSWSIDGRDLVFYKIKHVLSSLDLVKKLNDRTGTIVLYDNIKPYFKQEFPNITNALDDLYSDYWNVFYKNDNEFVLAILFPEITIKNSRGGSKVLTNMMSLQSFDINVKRFSSQLRGFKAIISDKDLYESSGDKIYLFSHFTAIDLEQYKYYYDIINTKSFHLAITDIFNDINVRIATCYGSGTTISALNSFVCTKTYNEIEEHKYYQFFEQIEKYFSWESLEGTPHTYMDKCVDITPSFQEVSVDTVNIIRVNDILTKEFRTKGVFLHYINNLNFISTGNKIKCCYDSQIPDLKDFYIKILKDFFNFHLYERGGKFFKKRTSGNSSSLERKISNLKETMPKINKQFNEKLNIECGFVPSGSNNKSEYKLDLPNEIIAYVDNEITKIISFETSIYE